MRVYTVEFENITIAAASGDIDFFEITPGDDHPCKIIAMTLDQISDVGDAAEEMIRFRVIRGHTTSGSGGATATPRPLNRSAVAATFTAETNNTTVASVGTVHNLHSGAFNIRVGLPLILTPEMYWEVSQTDVTMVVRLMAAVADDVTMSGTLYVLEEG